MEHHQLEDPCTSILLRTGDTIVGLDGAKTLARKDFDYIGFRGLGPSDGNDSAILGVNSELGTVPPSTAMAAAPRT